MDEQVHLPAHWVVVSSNKPGEVPSVVCSAMCSCGDDDCWFTASCGAREIFHNTVEDSRRHREWQDQRFQQEQLVAAEKRVLWDQWPQ